MFSSIGWAEIAVLALVALFIFGPDRLPGAAKQAGSALKSLKSQITGARKQIKDELGDAMPDFDRDLLNPKQFVRKHLWEDDDDSSQRTATSTKALPRTEPNKPAPYDIEAT